MFNLQAPISWHHRPSAPTLLAFLAILSALGFAAFAPRAEAGDYNVVFCSALDGAAASPTTRATNTGIIDPGDGCASGGGIGGIVKSGTSSGKDASASYTWTAPEGTSIASLQFAGNLRDQSNWASRVTAWGAAGYQWRPTAAPVAGYRNYSFDQSLTGGKTFTSLPDTKYTSFGLKTSCNPAVSNVRCSRTNVSAYGYIKDIKLVMRDSVAPTISLTSKRMFTEVNYGETGNVTIDVSDKGSGVASRTITVNGSPLPANMSGDRSYLGVCKTSLRSSSTATTFSPCPLETDAENVYLFTNDDPFQLGNNKVEVCATDFSGNKACVSDTVVVKPLPVEIETPQPTPGDTDSVKVEGQVGGVENSGVSGVIEVYSADKQSWVVAGQWKSGSEGQLDTKVELGKFDPVTTRQTKTTVNKCRKVIKRIKVRNPKTGKTRIKTKRVRRCKPVETTVTLRSFDLRARVTSAPKGYAGGTSDVERVAIGS